MMGAGGAVRSRMRPCVCQCAQVQNALIFHTFWLSLLWPSKKGHKEGSCYAISRHITRVNLAREICMIDLRYIVIRCNWKHSISVWLLWRNSAVTKSILPCQMTGFYHTKKWDQRSIISKRFLPLTWHIICKTQLEKKQNFCPGGSKCVVSITSQHWLL